MKGEIMPNSVVVFQPKILPPPPQFDYGRREVEWSGKKENEFLAFLAGILTYISSSCVPLLERKEPLSYQEWKLLFDWILTAWNSTAGSLVLPSLFSRTIRRGICDLATAIDKFEGDADSLYQEYCCKGPIIGAWFTDIAFQLCPERIPNEDTRRRLTYLFVDKVVVPLCKKSGGFSGLIHQMSRKLYPHDPRAQDAFVVSLREKAEKVPF